MTLYPRSFLQLILIGWLLVALPLLAAIAFAWHSLDGIAERGDAVVEQASLAGRIGWEMPEHLTHMERSVLQFEVLHTETLLEDYAEERAQWRKEADELGRIPLATALAGRVAAMLASEDTAYRAAVANMNQAAALREVLGHLRAETTTLLEELGQRVKAERESFRAETTMLRQRLLVGLAAAFALAALLFWFGRHLLARLLSRFERAVLALGQNRLDRRQSQRYGNWHPFICGGCACARSSPTARAGGLRIAPGEKANPTGAGETRLSLALGQAACRKRGHRPTGQACWRHCHLAERSGDSAANLRHSRCGDPVHYRRNLPHSCSHSLHGSHCGPRRGYRLSRRRLCGWPSPRRCDPSHRNGMTLSLKTEH